MSEHLYPTLIVDGSLTTPTADNSNTLQRQIISEIDKYLQEATEKHERDGNYYDGQHVATNTSSPQQEANFLEEDAMQVVMKELTMQLYWSLMGKTLVHTMEVLQNTTSSLRMSWKPSQRKKNHKWKKNKT